MAIRERLGSVQGRLGQEIRGKPIRTIGKVMAVGGFAVVGYNFNGAVGAQSDAIAAEAMALETTDPVRAEELLQEAAYHYGHASDRLGNALVGCAVAAGGVSVHFVATARDYYNRPF